MIHYGALVGQNRFLGEIRATIGAWRFIPAHLGNYRSQTNRPNNHPTDRPTFQRTDTSSHREVTLPIMLLLVSKVCRVILNVSLWGEEVVLLAAGECAAQALQLQTVSITYSSPIQKAPFLGDDIRRFFSHKWNATHFDTYQYCDDLID